MNQALVTNISALKSMTMDTPASMITNVQMISVRAMSTWKTIAINASLRSGSRKFMAAKGHITAITEPNIVHLTNSRALQK